MANEQNLKPFKKGQSGNPKNQPQDQLEYGDSDYRLIRASDRQSGRLFAI